MATVDVLYVGLMISPEEACRVFNVDDDRKLGRVGARRRQGLDLWTSWHDQIVLGKKLAESGTSHGSLVSCYDWSLPEIQKVIDDVEPRIRRLGLEGEVKLRYESSVRAY